VRKVGFFSILPGSRGTPIAGDVTAGNDCARLREERPEADWRFQGTPTLGSKPVTLRAPSRGDIPQRAKWNDLAAALAG